jgi:hypothetical protein
MAAGDVEPARRGERGKPGVVAELARRGEETVPFGECKELSDAFRSRLGVAEREADRIPLAATSAEDTPPFSRFCKELLGRAELGGRSAAPAAGKDLAGLAGVEDGVTKESCSSESSSSRSLFTTESSFLGDAD